MNFQPLTTIPDVSFWQDDNNTARQIDFVKMREQCDGVMIRAGQNLWIDPDFVYNWQAAKEAGLKRGSYHLYDSRADPIEQSKKFANLFRYDPPEWGLWGDLEESYGGAYAGEKNWKKFFDNTIYISHCEMGLYTNYYWWLSQTITMPAYWGTFPLWMAWYTNDPARVLLPPPWANKGAVLWQYTDSGDGSLYGVESKEIDLNKTSQAFYNLFGGVPSVPSDEISTPYDDVKMVTGTRSGWKFWLFVIDPQKVSYEVVHPSPYNIGTEIAKRTGADIVVNGGEPLENDSGVIIGIQDYSVVNGVTVIPRKEFVPSLIVHKDGTLRMYHETDPQAQQAISGERYLVVNGVNVIPPDGTEAKYTEGHSRHVEGVTADGKQVLLINEGVYPNQGLRLYECAELMRQYGANIAADMSGGGDTTLVIEGVLTNKPEDISNGLNVQRRLPQFLAIRTTGDTDMRYTAKAIDSTRIRPDHNTNNMALATVPAGTVLSGDVLFTAPANLYTTSGIQYQAVNDKWLQIGEGTYTGKWIAIVHMGGKICNLVDNGEVIPPAESRTLTVKVSEDGWQDATVVIVQNKL